MSESPDCSAKGEGGGAVQRWMVRGLLWSALAMAVAAQFMTLYSFHPKRIYRLWGLYFEAVKDLGRASDFSFRYYAGMVGFVVGCFCVTAAPWCGRILRQSASLRWISRVMVAVAVCGLGQVEGAFRRSPGIHLLLLSMVVTLLGLLLIRRRREER
ncbi:MAG: hypothetical protein QM755_02790 [Luteolibacter sp.]